jgi:hypothetical protein
LKDPLKKFYRKERLRKKIFWLSRAISRIQPEGKYYEMYIAKQLTPEKPYTIGVTIYRKSCIEKIYITRTTYKYLRFVDSDIGWQLIREGKTEDIVL